MELGFWFSIGLMINRMYTKKLIEAIMIISDRMAKDLIFCSVLDNTIHFGINPNKGGTPANESIKIIM
jgi:hypothetical protein